MDFFEAVESRYSYRGDFKNEIIPRKNLIKIVEAGLRAPSGRNLQTTEFIILDDQFLVSEINVLHKVNKAMQQARAYICCIVDQSPVESIYHEPSFHLEDCSAAVENMLLAITAMGYASVWIDGWLRYENRKMILGDLLKIPRNKKIEVILPVGIPLENLKNPKIKAFEERVFINKYQQ